MARTSNVLRKVASALTGKPDLDALRRRHDAANEAVAQAERDLASISFDVETGTLDASHETAALAKVAEAKAAADRLRIIVREAEAREGQSAAAARAAQEAAEDAKLAQAADDYRKAIAALAAVLPTYGDAYRKVAHTGDALNGLIHTNPRARRDLKAPHVANLVGEELARLNGGSGPLPPGTDTWATAARDLRHAPSLTERIADLVTAIKEGLGR